MNTQDFLLVATKIKEFSAYAIPFAVTLFSFLYVRARAGSAGFFHDRLWRLLGGKRDYQCPVLQAESDKLSDHEKFTYNTGIRFQNRHKIEEALQWMETQKIGIEEVVRTKAFFDPRDLSFRKPKLQPLSLSSQLKHLANCCVYHHICALLRSLCVAQHQANRNHHLGVYFDGEELERL